MSIHRITAEKVVELLSTKTENELADLARIHDVLFTAWELRDLRSNKLDAKTIRRWLSQEKKRKEFSTPKSQNNNETPYTFKTNGSLQTLDHPGQNEPQTLVNNNLGKLSPIFLKELEKHVNDIKALTNRLITEMHLPNLEILKVNMTNIPGTYEQASGPIGIFKRALSPQGMSKRPFPFEKMTVAFSWTVSDDKKVRLLCPSEIDPTNDRLFQRLLSHLRDPDYTSVIEMWERRRLIGGDILVQWDKIVAEVKEEIKRSTQLRDMVNQVSEIMLDYEDFAVTVCINAINIAQGDWTNLDIPDRQIACIGNICRFTNEGLLPTTTSGYEEYHLQLTEKYSKYVTVRKIGELVNDLKTMDKILSNKLDEFGRPIRPQGECEFCRGAWVQILPR